MTSNAGFKLKSRKPFTQCFHVSQGHGSVELVDRGLLVNFLTLYKQAVHTLIHAQGYDSGIWQNLWKTQITPDHLESLTIAHGKDLTMGEHFSLQNWISDALLYGHHNT